MPQDAFHIQYLSQELASAIVGGKINRIFATSKDELAFIIYTGKSTVKLILNANATFARVCLSHAEKTPLPTPSGFCMLLRKHLQGAEILSVTQKDFERIIEITMHCVSDFSQCERVLHCELMGKYSNILLTEKGIILGALKSTSLVTDSRRVLLSGAKYLYPVLQDKIPYLDRAGMRLLFEKYLSQTENQWDCENLAVFLFDHAAGFALSTAREIIKRFLQTQKEKTAENLTQFILDFCNLPPLYPCLKWEKQKPIDFFAFEVDGADKKASLCQAQDEFYTIKEQTKTFDDAKRKLENVTQTAKKKAQKRLQDHLQKLLDTEKAEEYRMKGELLTANLHRIEKGLSFVTLDNWYEEHCPSIQILLDATLSPSQNAQRYFKLYNKQKRAKEILLPRKEQEEQEIEYLDSILSNISLAENLTDLKEMENELVANGILRLPKLKNTTKKKDEPLPFREYFFEGYKILVGRNNLQNDRLLRLAKPDDIWLHAQKYHSAHVLILTENKPVPDTVLQFAGEVCGYFSKGRDADKLPIDYCLKKFVKKPKNSKAGFVVYTDYKTIFITPKKHEQL